MESEDLAHDIACSASYQGREMVHMGIENDMKMQNLPALNQANVGCWLPVIG